MRRASLSRFVGAWFNIFPFSLSDLSGRIRAEECEKPERRSWEDTDDCIRREGAFGKISAEMASEVQKHNDGVNTKCGQLALNSSTDCDLIGGTCSAATGLEGVLKRYFSEMFAEDVVDSSGYRDRNGAEAWMDRGRGLLSRHRTMRSIQDALDPRKAYYGQREPNNLRACLSNKEEVFAISNLESGCRDVNTKTQSLKGMLDHLESVHHSSVPFIEGLTVELLEFQRQSVQWALEREMTPGGVQSFLWAKLPSVAEPGEDIYYSPILERFRRGKPKLVRGGIIAEEMGLGKTVISLALILQNPAPAVPQSGSPIAVLDNISNDTNVASAAGTPTPWDKDLYSRTSLTNSKRGSILSRGTLVVVRMIRTFSHQKQLCCSQSPSSSTVSRLTCGAVDRRGKVKAVGPRPRVPVSRQYPQT